MFASAMPFEGDPKSILASACKMKLEGIISKRADAPYVSKRTEDWLKLKCKQRQEFVVVGYTNRTNTTNEVGSLILAVYSGEELIPAGSVGTGWSSTEAKALKQKLSRIERDSPPFDGEVKKPGRWSKRKPGEEIWVEPRLVAEVEFSEWTPDGQIRHPSYIALRTDKKAASVTREQAK
jgi:bifunctional non-homologous end joining protein LigD